MPKKGGGGGKKGDALSKMTAEQRREFMERRAAQEQEKIRRREELLAAFLKLKLDDERKKAAINEAKLNVKWRSVLREAKTTSLKSQLKNLKTWTDETVTSQDKMIHMLISSLQEARHQRTNAAQKHLSFIHKLAALHEEHVSILTTDFRDQEFNLLKTTASSIQGTARKHIYHLQRLGLANRAANELTQEEESKEIIYFQNAVAAIKTKLEEEAALVAAEEEEELQNAWWRLATTLKEFEEETKDLRKDCKVLQNKVDSNMATRERIEQEIRDMQSEIALWQGRFAEEEIGQVESDEGIDFALQTLRDSYTTQRIRFREAVKVTNRIANSAFEGLTETILLGEEVLHLADLCRRLETVEDKNLPFRPSLPPTGVPSAVIHEDPSTCILPVEDNSKEAPYQRPPESDSGVGSSLKTMTTVSTPKTEDEKAADLRQPKLEKVKGVHDREDVGGGEIKSLLVQPIPENPLETLPKVTMERIQKLLKEEVLLEEISQRYKGQQNYQKNHQPPSDYILKEAELLLRTNDWMSHFWKKLNNVQVQRLSLRKEAEDLQRENQRLKKTLKVYLLSQGISDGGLALSKAPMCVSMVPVLTSKKTKPPPASKTKEESTKEEKERKQTKVKSKIEKQIPIIEGNSVIKSMKMHNHWKRDSLNI